ncbi:hypothetical protein K470DRAFT_219399 [Piedraia hortae CBS 480.64]|uniref:GID complex catalytic subunit 2 n=1 Tax=Piedraia hortae CBS 480.64 TaxID=1314780 RepID=A0A6A7BVR9_9PEZI|nr:hypothetical protein K470DRAFT_219399 [Piedraia hortae CBS 480.64]
MDALLSAHEQVSANGLERGVDILDNLISLLESQKAQLLSQPATITVPKSMIQDPFNDALTSLNEELLKKNKALNAYGKALKDKSPNAASHPQTPYLPSPTDYQHCLIDRSIAVHLLREGKFDVAETFMAEAEDSLAAKRLSNYGEDVPMTDINALNDMWAAELFPTGTTSNLTSKFKEMYSIISALEKQDLVPAMSWAAAHSEILNLRKSDLQFHLVQLQFVKHYATGDAKFALEYARFAFPSFAGRYHEEVAALLGSLAFINSRPPAYLQNVLESVTYPSVVENFVTEFCASLNLPPSSPLYPTVAAGSLALPVLQKLASKMNQARSQWSTEDELPVETPMPDEKFRFHSIFVCPISKQQSTDKNPPTLLKCGHVLAQESVHQLSRNRASAKCPYCSADLGINDTRRVYIVD